MKEGPQYLRTTDLAALAENPHLWQLIMSQVHGGAGVGRAADAAGRGGEGMDEGDDDDDSDRAEVTCRVN